VLIAVAERPETVTTVRWNEGNEVGDCAGGEVLGLTDGYDVSPGRDGLRVGAIGLTEGYEVSPGFGGLVVGGGEGKVVGLTDGCLVGCAVGCVVGDIVGAGRVAVAEWEEVMLCVLV